MWLMSDSSRTSCAHCNEDGWLALHSCIQSYPQWRRRKSLQEGAEDLTVICIWQDSRVSLGCKLVPVQYREYENFLFWGTQRSYIRYVSRRFWGHQGFSRWVWRAARARYFYSSGKNKSRCKNYGQLLMPCSVDYLQNRLICTRLGTNKLHKFPYYIYLKLYFL